MKTVILVLTGFLLLLGTALAQTSSIYSIHPRPKGCFAKTDTFTITRNTPLIIPDTLTPEVSKAIWLLQTYIRSSTDDTLQTIPSSQYQGDSGIFIGERTNNLSLNRLWNTSLSVIEEEPDSQGYQLDITKKAILIRASDAPGLWFGIVTLRQLFNTSKPTIAILGAHVWDKPDYLQRWAYIASSVRTPSASNQSRLWIDSMIYYKFNGLIDSSVFFTDPEGQPQSFQDSMSNWSAFIHQRNLGYAPAAISIATANGPTYFNANLASGLLSKSIYAITSAGPSLVVDSAMFLLNGNLESYNGTSFSDWSHDANSTFRVDSVTVHGGKYSARWQSSCKISQTHFCRKFHCYTMSGWAKTQGAFGVKIQLSVVGIDSNGTRRLLADTIVKSKSPTNDWFKLSLSFNTLSSTQVVIRYGTIETQGTIWWDDLALSEVTGPITALRRNSTPIIVKNIHTGMIYNGNTDYNLFPYFFLRTPSNIHTGDTVEASYYYYLPSPYLTTSLSEDSTYLLLSKQALSLKNKFSPSQYLLHESDIRIMNWDPSDLNRHLSPASILGDHITRADSIFKTIGGVQSNYLWSDMIDTFANAKNNYRLINGDLRQTYSLIPNSLTILNTNELHRDSSLKYLYLRGFSQVGAVSVDSGKPDAIRYWRIALDSIPNADRTRIRGALYLTRTSNYTLFRPFANYFWSAGSFAVHTPLDNDALYEDKIQITAEVYPDPYDSHDSVTDVNIATYNSLGHLTHSYSLEKVTKTKFARPIINTFKTGFSYRILTKNKQGIVGYGPLYTLLPNGAESVLLIAPINNIIDTSASLTFQWYGIKEATSYRIRISSDSVFQSSEVDVIVKDTFYLSTLPTIGRPYFWKVRAIVDGKQGPWSQVRRLIKGQLPTAPILISPKKNFRDTTTQLSFRWRKAVAVPEIGTYDIVIASDSLFTTILYSNSPTDTTDRFTASTNSHYF